MTEHRTRPTRDVVDHHAPAIDPPRDRVADRGQPKHGPADDDTNHLLAKGLRGESWWPPTWAPLTSRRDRSEQSTNATTTPGGSS